MVAIVTGSAGLIGAEAVRFFANKGMDVVGIDNDMRSYFFGKEASTNWSKFQLIKELKNYSHADVDVRNYAALEKIFRKFGTSIDLILHTAAQPSHDWAAKEPLTDFQVNANGTLNLLELTRLFSPSAVFIFTSTNKVYGDHPNYLPFEELETRWEISAEHKFYNHGIDETMGIDSTLHSLFGTSKLAADVLVQEYGRYFQMHTVCFRGGCLTGPGHSGAELHGFLSYLAKCALTGTRYTVYGYNGKQVRDNIHSNDLVDAFWHFFLAPRIGEVYNIGGGRYANCSMLEAISMAEQLTGREFNWTYSKDNRTGDHIWWISDISRFRLHYPQWEFTHDIRDIMRTVINGQAARLEK